jgi:hypothetical protein
MLKMDEKRKVSALFYVFLSLITTKIPLHHEKIRPYPHYSYHRPYRHGAGYAALCGETV